MCALTKLLCRFILKTMYKSKLLENTYKNLGLDFVIDEEKHIYIHNFSINEFYCYYNIGKYEDKLNENNNNKMSRRNAKSKCIYKGQNGYYYSDIYEALLWYNYYKYQKRHILSHDYLGKTNGPVNTSYFSRIPHHYRNLCSKKGLHLIKEILDQIIIENNGLPGYFDPKILGVLFYVK